eukprot:TRINITY_DN28663_c0_g1_i1.p1 TRINITY_DN28663_c0_g1~~TRINITY_DN28663_c0_g1_i1.p1  ORF type:complete len:105 (-),score=0.59 TRINITY_DN28663_c0_g1_i1:309-623(-)
MHACMYVYIHALWYLWHVFDTGGGRMPSSLLLGGAGEVVGTRDSVLPVFRVPLLENREHLSLYLFSLSNHHLRHPCVEESWVECTGCCGDASRLSKCGGLYITG